MSRSWTTDVLSPAFEATTIDLPSEKDGELVATLVRRCTPELSRRAVLYVHGFVDYFFQEHVAGAFVEKGWDFYAIDLRRYGRSLRPGNRPNFCRNLSEYDRELTAAIDIVRQEGEHETVLLMGHSTGGLIASLYADSGTLRESIDGVVLNSPFFEFFVTPAKRAQLPIAALIGRALPTLSDPKGLSPRYLESVSKNYDGEWEINEAWKPLRGFPVYYGWIGAVQRGHSRVARGLSIPVPVLLMHSSHSMMPAGRGDPRHFTHDIVLNIADMREHGRQLGKQVTLRRIDDGMHDLFLSPEPVRTQAIEEVFKWIASAIGEKRIIVREFRT